MIKVVDQCMTQADGDDFFRAVYGSFYKLVGARDRENYTVPMDLCIHSAWDTEDVDNVGLMDMFTSCEVTDFIGARVPTSIMCHLAHPGDTFYQHTHKGQDVVLLYPDIEWKREWAGETLFYHPTTDEILAAVEYKPRRAVLFDGNIPHTIRPATYRAPKLRTTFSMFFRKEYDE